MEEEEDRNSSLSDPTYVGYWEVVNTPLGSADDTPISEGEGEAGHGSVLEELTGSLASTTRTSGLSSLLDGLTLLTHDEGTNSSAFEEGNVQSSEEEGDSFSRSSSDNEVFGEEEPGPKGDDAPEDDYEQTKALRELEDLEALLAQKMASYNMRWGAHEGIPSSSASGSVETQEGLHPDMNRGPNVGRHYSSKRSSSKSLVREHGSARWNFFWNTRWLEIQQEQNDLVRFKQQSSHARDFVEEATLVAHVIISERDLPDFAKTIRPLRYLGGVAGGDKYIAHGILFKYAQDRLIRVVDPRGRDSNCSKALFFYGGDSADHTLAKKSVGHELKGLNAIYTAATALQSSSQSHHYVRLCAPLSVSIECQGFRLFATALLPINGTSTLTYGTAPKEKVFRAAPDVAPTMERICHMLNLRVHKVWKHKESTSSLPAAALDIPKTSAAREDGGEERTARTITIGPCADIEVHQGSDGRRYILDFSRVFPPESPMRPEWHCTHFHHTTRRAIFFYLLRPELVRLHSRALCSDAFSSFVDFANSEEKAEVLADELAIQEVTLHLRDVVIPRFADRLVAALSTDNLSISSLRSRTAARACANSPSTDQAELQLQWPLHRKDLNMLVLDLHSCGVNLRYIGEVRYYVLKAEAVLERSERTKATDELCGPEREKGGEKRDVKSEEKNRREGERQGLLTMGSLQDYLYLPDAANSLLIEMVARTWKDIIHECLRTKRSPGPAHAQNPLRRHVPADGKKEDPHPPLRQLLLGLLNRLIGRRADSREFWKAYVTPLLLEKFGCRALMPAEIETFGPHAVMPNLLAKRLLINRVCGMVPISLHCRWEAAINFESFEFTFFDLAEPALGARVKHMSVIDYSEGRALLSEAQAHRKKWLRKNRGRIRKYCASVSPRGHDSLAHVSPSNPPSLPPATWGPSLAKSGGSHSNGSGSSGKLRRNRPETAAVAHVARLRLRNVERMLARSQESLQLALRSNTTSCGCLYYLAVALLESSQWSFSSTVLPGVQYAISLLNRLKLHFRFAQAELPHVSEEKLDMHLGLAHLLGGAWSAAFDREETNAAVWARRAKDFISGPLLSSSQQLLDIVEFAEYWVLTLGTTWKLLRAGPTPGVLAFARFHGMAWLVTTTLSLLMVRRDMGGGDDVLGSAADVLHPRWYKRLLLLRYQPKRSPFLAEWAVNARRRMWTPPVAPSMAHLTDNGGGCEERGWDVLPSLPENAMALSGDLSGSSSDYHRFRSWRETEEESCIRVLLHRGFSRHEVVSAMLVSNSCEPTVLEALILTQRQSYWG